MFTTAFLEGFGSPIHWLILGLVMLLIFGRRLPEVGRNFGRGITEFKRGLKDVQNESEQPDQHAHYQQSPPPRAYASPQPPAPAPRLQPPGPAPQSTARVTRQDMVD